MGAGVAAAIAGALAFFGIVALSMVMVGKAREAKGESDAERDYATQDIKKARAKAKAHADRLPTLDELADSMRDSEADR